MEKRVEVKTYIVYKICPKCGDGKMFYEDGKILITDPAQYPHICDKCGYKSIYFEHYPKIEYELIKEEE